MSELDVREQILAAAMKRFSHYGYSKTTMAELAQDCNMSAGNLYRFFPGKLDIAEAIATEEEDRRLEAYIELAGRGGLAPREKLREFLFLELRGTYSLLEKDAKILEMAMIITHERPQYANRRLAIIRKLLAQILGQGNAEGVFAVPDPDFAGEMILAATMKFHYPQLWSRLSLVQLERELAGVFELLVYGIAAPGVKPSRRPILENSLISSEL